MIVRDKPSWHELAFAVRGSIVPMIAPRIAALMLFSAIMVWLHHGYSMFPEVGGAGFTVFGIALSLFLGFRNNAAYDRWWEARRLWGGLLADLRSFAREAGIFVRDDALRIALIRQTLAFMHLHRANLRRIAPDAQAMALAQDAAQASGDAAHPHPHPPAHPPCAALDGISSRIAAAYRAGGIDGFGARALDERLASIAVQQAGCERIATTPLPYVYSLLIYRTTYIYCLLLPTALVGPAGWFTPLFVGIVAYVFLGLAEVTEDLSHPFGKTPNALPLDAICRAAEISLAPHLGEQAPEPLEAREFYLS